MRTGTKPELAVSAPTGLVCCWQDDIEKHYMDLLTIEIDAQKRELRDSRRQWFLKLIENTQIMKELEKKEADGKKEKKESAYGKKWEHLANKTEVSRKTFENTLFDVRRRPSRTVVQRLEVPFLPNKNKGPEISIEELEQGFGFYGIGKPVPEDAPSPVSAYMEKYPKCNLQNVAYCLGLSESTVKNIRKKEMSMKAASRFAIALSEGDRSKCEALYHRFGFHPLVHGAVDGVIEICAKNHDTLVGVFKIQQHSEEDGLHSYWEHLKAFLLYYDVQCEKIGSLKKYLFHYDEKYESDKDIIIPMKALIKLHGLLIDDRNTELLDIRDAIPDENGRMIEL
ncbi:MAG: hypothetical protein IJO88_06230 [Oscillospiraceae bacterium]|nr:hypothetical protein [Oscillospiraceae bacterium]